MRRTFSTPSSVWALADQGLVSLGGAATSIILARSLEPSEFGVYVLLFGVMLALNTIHASFVVYPLSIRGARATRPESRRLLASSFVLALTLALLLALPLAGATVALSSWRLVPWVVCALLAWQAQETLRRALFAELRHRAAIPGDVLAYLGQAALIFALDQRGDVTLSAVFAALIVTSLTGLAAQLVYLRPVRIERESVASFAGAALGEGGWVLPSNLLGTFIMQGLLWALALVENASSAADLQAVITIAGVANPIMFGIGNLVTPLMAGARRNVSNADARRQFGAAIGQGGLLLLPYALLLWVIPGRVLGLVYGAASPYAGLTTPLRLLALAYLLVYLAHVTNAGLFGLEQLRDALTVQIVGTATLVAAGLLLTLFWGLTGAALATVVVHLVRAIVSARALRLTLSPNARRATSLAESV